MLSFHIPSASNPGDDPSRDVPVRAPNRKPPPWFSAVQACQFSKFYIAVYADQFIRPLGAWVRIILMRCGDIEPHPGPSATMEELRVTPLQELRGVRPAERRLRDQ